jgi:hypothetical protein
MTLNPKLALLNKRRTKKGNGRITDLLGSGVGTNVPELQLAR